MIDPNEAEIEAWIRTIDSKNERLLIMWRDRALKAEARIEALESALRDIEATCMDAIAYGHSNIANIILGRIARAALDKDNSGQ